MICVAESWLNDSVSNAILDPQGLFDIYRHDRPTHGGVVVAFVLKSLNSTGLSLLNNYNELECLIFDIRGKYCKLRVFVIYRSGTGRNSFSNACGMNNY